MSTSEGSAFWTLEKRNSIDTNGIFPEFTTGTYGTFGSSSGGSGDSGGSGTGGTGGSGTGGTGDSGTGGSGGSTTTTTTTGSAPAAPTNIRGSFFNNGLNLGWSRVTGATSYAVSIYSSNGTDQGSLLMGPKTTTNAMFSSVSYPDKGALNNNSNVYYSITASNSFGTSAPATGIQTSFSLTPPDSPTNITLTQRGMNMDISWNAPANTGSFPLLGYDIEYLSTTNGVNTVYTPLRTTGTDTVCTIENLNFGVDYSVAVIARSSAGRSPSNVAATHLTLSEQKDGPQSVVAVAGYESGNSSSSVTVTWGAPTDTLDKTLTGYEISIKDVGYNHTVELGNPLSYTYTASELTIGTPHVFIVSAKYSTGTQIGSTSNKVIPFTAPSAPRDLSCNIGVNFAHLTWRVPENTGGREIWYRVSVNQAGHSQPQTQLALNTNAVIDGLQPGQTYTFSVSAETAINSGAARSVPSNSITASTVQGTSTISQAQIYAASLSKGNETTTTYKNVNWRGRTGVNVVVAAVRDGGTVVVSEILDGETLHIPLSSGAANVVLGGITYGCKFYNTAGTTFASITPGFENGVALGTGVSLGHMNFVVSGLGSIDLTREANAAVCFLGNAPVLTPAGYKRMDSLRVGDIVVAADGKTAAIQRVFKQTYEPSDSVNPYVIPAGRFGATRRLLISPDHCVAVDGAMVKARNLGLQQQTMAESFVYYNLELPSWKNMVVAGVEVESLAPKTRVRMTMAVFTEYLNRLGLNATVPMVRRAVRYLQDGTVEVHGCFKPRDRK